MPDQMNSSPAAPNPAMHLKSKWPLILLAVLFLAALIAAIYYYNQYNQIKKDPNRAVDQQNSALIAKVGALIELPAGETPTIATVTDPNALKSQAFFANAKIGDKVLIYTNAKEAILYDPAANKIVEVAPVDLGANAAPAPAPAAKPSK